MNDSWELRHIENLAYQAYARQFGLPDGHRDLRTMPYDDFLETKYWWDFRARLLVMRLNGVERCESCLTRGPVQLHHKTYAHRGFEYWFPHDLIFLCEPCHYNCHFAADGSRLHRGVYEKA